MKSGQDYLFDIDWQGTQQLKQKDDQDVVTVFVLPPSLDDLRRRLGSRAQDSDDATIDLVGSHRAPKPQNCMDLSTLDSRTRNVAAIQA